MMKFLHLLFVCFCREDCHSEQKNIPLVMSTNEKYVRQLVVTLTSLFENAKPNTFFHVTILVPGDFGNENKVKIGTLQQRYKNYKIVFIHMSDKYKKMTSAIDFSFCAFYRLETASLLPAVKKCIYLDSDVVVRHDLSEMYDINIEDNYIAGVADVNVAKDGTCLNSGVLIMNLEKIREDKLEYKFFEFADVNKSLVVFADQSILNYVCQPKTLVLPQKFGFLIDIFDVRVCYENNELAKLVLTETEWEAMDPVIVHFAGRHKPWKRPMRTFFHEEYWNYAMKTTLYSEKEKVEASMRHRKHHEMCRKHRKNYK